MSSRPLISHHLFVAAVKARNRGPRQVRVKVIKAGPTEVRVREVSMELVDFGRPSPVAESCPSEAIPWIGLA